MISVIDYEVGNLRSVEKALQSLGYDAKITSDPEDIRKSDRVILPGVGAFGDCRRELKESGLEESVVEFVATGRPVLGICVGMQMLFEKDYEFGEHDGFGYFKGSVRKFPDEIVKQGMKIPQIGWNQVIKKFEHPLLEGINTGDYFYFVHSYRAMSENPDAEALTCVYGEEFTAMVIKGNIAATQFHPEKSQKLGLHLLNNFAVWNV
ncbi:imidazole glycerol phosphate synthase, glutamine amidotransferase subunit [Denitrovibrio acetiphilus DSM 12809]|uniref:Imidazole glycerol phosphate synthase subunit HisH n=1 Tax=Denitrovibrio acetiphilus (strain DSM 12809 / NBRC 114555 / N2460) TaxID=522772 RepID=D4H5V6_DENA2|nr:imidazole glycerol phosphate synthase subunit HisH [Denitrovibrio acetiphilus]ADD69547.1 imidazole glycerol phosphate synthase, glutamine amidotransferase subunit [Denitrovibrio acetiphilus DSM 12809]